MSIKLIFVCLCSCSRKKRKVGIAQIRMIGYCWAFWKTALSKHYHEVAVTVLSIVQLHDVTIHCLSLTLFDKQ
jgi:hypothetical protein